MAKLYNIVRVFTTTTGTGPITLGGAVAGFLTFAQGGVPDGTQVSYGIKDGNNSEVGVGTYTSAGAILTRDAVSASTNVGAFINLSGSAEVYITARAQDIVEKTGDTMTGQLVVQSHISATTGGHIWSQTTPTTGIYQFGAGVANLTYDGSFYLSGGALNCSGAVRANYGAASPAIYYFGSGDVYWYYDGSTIQTTANLLVGGDINAGGNINATANCGGATVIASQGNVTIRKGAAANPVLWLDEDSAGSHRSVLYFDIPTGQTKLQDWYSGGWLHIDPSGIFKISGGAYKPGGGAWLDSSDARIKNVEGDYTRGLDAVAALRPITYTFKGNDTPTAPSSEVRLDDQSSKDAAIVPYGNSGHYHPAKARTKFAGLVAQEVETIFPEMVTKREGYIDGAQVTDLRDLDTTPLVFALINAVKELKARVEALEAV